MRSAAHGTLLVALKVVTVFFVTGYAVATNSIYAETRKSDLTADKKLKDLNAQILETEAQLVSLNQQYAIGEMRKVLLAPESPFTGVTPILLGNPSSEVWWYRNYPHEYLTKTFPLEMDRGAQEAKRLGDEAHQEWRQILRKNPGVLDSTEHQLVRELLIEIKRQKPQTIPISLAEQIATQRTQEAFGDLQLPERDQFYRRALFVALEQTREEALSAKRLDLSQIQISSQESLELKNRFHQKIKLRLETLIAEALVFWQKKYGGSPLYSKNGPITFGAGQSIHLDPTNGTLWFSRDGVSKKEQLFFNTLVTKEMPAHLTVISQFFESSLSWKRKDAGAYAVSELWKNHQIEEAFSYRLRRLLLFYNQKNWDEILLFKEWDGFWISYPVNPVVQFIFAKEAQTPGYWKNREIQAQQKKRPHYENSGSAQSTPNSESNTDRRRESLLRRYSELVRQSDQIKGLVKAPGSGESEKFTVFPRFRSNGDYGNSSKESFSDQVLFRVSRTTEYLYLHLPEVSEPSLRTPENTLRWLPPDRPLPLGITVESGAPMLLPKLVIGIPSPRGKQLQSIQWSDHAQGITLKEGEHYRVFRDPKQGGYWVEFLDQGLVSHPLSFKARFQGTVAADLLTAASPFTQAQGKVMVETLRAAQLRSSATAVQKLFASHAQVHPEQLARALRLSGRYSFTPEKISPHPDASGPLADFSRFAGEDGVFYSQCSGAAALFCDLVKTAAQNTPDVWGVQSISGFLVSPLSGQIKSKDAHAFNVLAGPNGRWMYVDATPSQKGEPKTQQNLLRLHSSPSLVQSMERDVQHNKIVLEREQWQRRLRQSRKELVDVFKAKSREYAILQNPERWDPRLPYAQIPAIVAVADALESGELTVGQARERLQSIDPAWQGFQDLSGVDDKQAVLNQIKLWFHPPQGEGPMARLEKLKRSDRVRYFFLDDRELLGSLVEVSNVLREVPPTCGNTPLKDALERLGR